MRKYLLYVLSAIAVMACTSVADPLQLADPFVGTGFHGHTFPGATTPFGMVQLSPDTRNTDWDACGGYHYSDSTLFGFSHTHISGTGCADMTDFLFTPSLGSVDYDGSPLHTFSHSDESASPGYYSVALKDIPVKVELTALPHTGVHHYSFSGTGERVIIIDLDYSTGEQVTTAASFEISGDREISGMHVNDGWIEGHASYFNALFSEPFAAAVPLSEHVMALSFGEDVTDLYAAVGLSLNSCDKARQNRISELPELDFEAARTRAEAMWREQFAKISIQGGSLRERKNFYSALYHTMVSPNLISDAGEPERYSTFSTWDTFRAWHPLQTLLNVDLTLNVIRTSLDFYRRHGELPLWPLCDIDTKCMIGYHSVSVIADAYMKGIRDFDAEYALEAMVHSSNINWKGSDAYIAYGYIPADMYRESASVTLEFAYDDWCIARMAEAMGRDDIAAEYYGRCQNYANLFDSSTGFYRGRNRDGNWNQPFNIYDGNRAFTEAIPWQYRFAAMHDVRGMENLMGGREAMISALDALFTDDYRLEGTDIGDMTGMMGQYAHGNEPSHHVAYLYNWLGEPWKTQKYTRAVMDGLYEPTPEGICGNEDCGQMSAWYVLTAAGLYPVCPGSGEFALTAPLFKKMEIALSNGRTLTISADRPGCAYIRSVALNGEEVETNYITYDLIMEGGELAFRLSDSPVTDRGTSDDAAPYSYTDAAMTSMPSVEGDVTYFQNQVTISLTCATEGAEIHYTLDGSEPDEASDVFAGPFVLENTTEIRARAYKDGMEPGPVFRCVTNKVALRAAVSVSGLEPGLRYSYWTGGFSRTSQIGTGRLVSSGIMPEAGIADAPDADHFAYIFEGYVDVPEDGMWEFGTWSDDGSVLEIDGIVAVDNDGSHAYALATGIVPLRKGLHSLRLLYFEDYEGEGLSLVWRAPGEDKLVKIPADRLYHK